MQRKTQKMTTTKRERDEKKKRNKATKATREQKQLVNESSHLVMEIRGVAVGGSCASDICISIECAIRRAGEGDDKQMRCRGRERVSCGVVHSAPCCLLSDFRVRDNSFNAAAH